MRVVDEIRSIRNKAAADREDHRALERKARAQNTAEARERGVAEVAGRFALCLELVKKAASQGDSEERFEIGRSDDADECARLTALTDGLLSRFIDEGFDDTVSRCAIDGKYFVFALMVHW